MPEFQATMWKYIIHFFLIAQVQILAAQTPRADSLFSVMANSREDTLKVKLLGKLSQELQSTDTKKSIALANSQLELAQKLNFKTGMANAWNNMGVVSRIMGDYAKSIDYFNKSISLFEVLGDERSIAINLSNIGAVYFNMSDYVTAATYSLKALKIKEKLGDPKSLASSYINVGAFYFQMEDMKQADFYFLRALDINRKLNDHTGIANALVNLGQVRFSNSEFRKAGTYYAEALSEALTGGNRELEARARLFLGICYVSIRNYTGAVSSMQRSLAIAEDLHDMETAAQNLKNIGTCYREWGKLDSSVYYLELAVKRAELIGARDLLQQSCLELSESYSSKLEFANALLYYKKFASVRDSVFNIENAKQIALIQTRYDLEKKDNQIVLLGKDKDLQTAIIARQRVSKNYLLAGFALMLVLIVVLFLFYNQKKMNAFERQVSQVEMTALRAQMNPHFIFNSLNSIHKFIQMKDPDQASEYLLKFSKLMRLILENSRFQEVSLEKDLQALDLYIQLESSRLNNNITYEIIIDPAIDPETTLVPPLILQPFVENAIWHGLQHRQETGKIRIEIRKEGEMINCIVEDNGIGRFKAQELKTQSPTYKGESLGMKITDARINIINKIKKTKASIHLADLAVGFRVEVKLPLELRF